MLKKGLCCLLSVSFILFLFLEVIDISCFDRSFYEKEYAKIGVAEDIGISLEDLMDATDVLLDYTRQKREDMVVEAEIKGQIREVYNEREKAHMVDVSALYMNAMKIKNGCRVIFVVCILLLYFMHEDYGFTLSQIFNRVSLLFLALIGAVALYAASDFNTFWIRFHHVFFTKNDYWLLNPKTDILINMVPEQFFYDLVFKIVLLFFTGFLLANGIAVAYRKKALKNA